MWLLKSTHKHISQDTLSEYLDGRLQGRPLERVELQMEQCDACRLELSELQATVSMMQQLPMEQLRRSFVMSAPPLDLPLVARSRPSIFLRVPSLVYAGAASFAVLALVATVAVSGAFQQASDSANQQFALSSPPQAESANRVTSNPELDAIAAERSGDTSGTNGDQDAPVSMAAAPVAPPPEPSALSEPAEAPVAAFSAESPPQDTTAGLAVPELASEPSPETAGAAGADGGEFLKIDEADAISSVPEKASEEPITEGPSISQTTAQADSGAPIPEQAQGPEPVPELINENADDGSFNWEWWVATAAVVVMIASLVGLYLSRRAARREFP